MASSITLELRFKEVAATNVPHLHPHGGMIAYGLYKQATMGDSTNNNSTGKKAEAWSRRRGMNKEDAMREYIRVVSAQIRDYDRAPVVVAGKDSTEVAQLFKEVCTKVEQSTTDKLAAYALYKQATMGDITISRPSNTKMDSIQKWEAWSRRRGMSKEDAMREYIRVVSSHIRDYDAPISHIPLHPVSPSVDPNAYQLGPETAKTVSGHVGEDTRGAYGEHEVHKAGLGISMSPAFFVTEVSETGQCWGKVKVGDTLAGAQFSTLDQLGISTVAQFEEYMVGRGGYGGKTDTYLHFNCMPLLKAKKRDIVYPVPEPEPEFQMTCGCVLFTMLWAFLVIFCGYLAALETFKHIHKDDSPAAPKSEAPKLGTTGFKHHMLD